MAQNVHTLDYIHVHGLNMILASMALNYAVVKFHHLCRMSTKIHHYPVPYLYGRWKMWAMKNAPYRLHSHLKMGPEPKNKMPKVRSIIIT